MVDKGTKRPYVQCIGHSSIGVTQSCYVIRYKKYKIVFDCGLYQEADIATNYKNNKELLKKIKPQNIDWIILHECHVDHTGLIPALYAQGCKAHLIVPEGSTDILKLLWEDTMKIFTQDCVRLNRTGKKATPFYTQQDIEIALDRIVEVPVKTRHYLTNDISFMYYPANHIIYACQIAMEFQEGSIIKRLNFTGDVGGSFEQPYVLPRETLPYCNLLLSESTYNEPERKNQKYDREKDLEKIVAVINNSHRVLFPCFSLGRTQLLLTELYRLYKQGKLKENICVLLDSPLAQRICNVWPLTKEWREVITWDKLHCVANNEETVARLGDHKPYIILSASGFLSGGKVVEWLKAVLPDRRNTVMFCGYSGKNNLASQIRFGQKDVKVEKDMVSNNANIIELVSFSSHASYEELTDYLLNQCRYDKVILVHGESTGKTKFAHMLQDKLAEQGKSSRVIASNMDTKVYF